jgi:carboxypeptidase family protein
MRICLPILLCAGALHAALIQGTVVEAQTGRPLARTVVTAKPVAGTSGSERSVHTNAYGAFVIEELQAGAYLVTASRLGFAATQYGQKQWKSAGLPIVLETPQKMQIEIRLPRLGAIAGKIVDENEVGLAQYDVVVYRNTQPPIFVNRMSTDDRGMYRFGLLDPGAYLIRTAAKTYEESGYLPTFHKNVTAVEQARQIDVMLDQQAEDINVQPLGGHLFKVAGVATTPTMLESITVTLVSDMGPESVTADSRTGRFQFNSQAPGKFELEVTAGALAGYLPFELERDQTDLRISASRLPGVIVTFEDNKGGRVDPAAVQVLARRRKLSGPGPVETLNMENSRVSLMPGRWEFALAPNPAYYVTGFMMNNRPAQGRTDGWNDVNYLSGPNYTSASIRFTLSASPGAVHGAVNYSSQPVPGVPVFLEPVDLEPGKRITTVRMARTDARGQYQFTGLAPGQYRLLGTFEYQSPESADMEAARAFVVKIEENRDLQQDLELFLAH